MDKPQETPYRHERLTPGCFQIPGTVHMHFYVGAKRDVLRNLRELLVKFGATPKESFVIDRAGRIGYVLSIPIAVKEELANYALLILRA